MCLAQDTLSLLAGAPMHGMVSNPLELFPVHTGPRVATCKIFLQGVEGRKS